MSAEFSSVVAELSSGRHTKLLEMIYHLMLIRCKGSSRMETTFASTGDSRLAWHWMLLWATQSPFHAWESRGKEMNSFASGWIPKESSLLCQVLPAPRSTQVVFNQPQEGPLSAVQHGAHRILDFQPCSEQEFGLQTLNSALLHLFLLTLLFYQE